MSEKFFIITCQIIKNEFDILIKALADFRANNLVFINIFCVIDAAKFLNITVICLPTSVSVTDYDEKSDIIITHAIMLHL